jgi:hypothetical protein
MNAQTILKCIVILYVTMTLVGRTDAVILDDQTVETTNFHGTAPDTTILVGPTNSVVGPGVELNDFGWLGFVDIDFSDTNILIKLSIPQPSGYSEALRFLDVNGTIPDLTGVTVNAATNWAGFNTSRISQFNANLIDLNLTGLQGQQGQQISLDLTANTAISSTTTIVPQTTTTIGKGPCPAEEIYGEYSEEIKLLRYFRDNVLSQTPTGKEIIKLYYRWSPVIVRVMEKDEDFKGGVKEMIDEVLRLITEEVE